METTEEASNCSLLKNAAIKREGASSLSRKKRNET